MTRYVPLDELRKRFEVVPTDDLTAREPTKYFDPFAEKESE